MKILKKKIFWISLKKNLVPRMLSHRGNVRTSKFWQKWMQKKRNFFRKIYQGHIRIWFRSKKNSKLSHAFVPLMVRFIRQTFSPSLYNKKITFLTVLTKLNSTKISWRTRIHNLKTGKFEVFKRSQLLYLLFIFC